MKNESSKHNHDVGVLAFHGSDEIPFLDVAEVAHSLEE
jgi:hypothetical protein